jgi:hypothetical protein
MDILRLIWRGWSGRVSRAAQEVRALQNCRHDGGVLSPKRLVVPSVRLAPGATPLVALLALIVPRSLNTVVSFYGFSQHHTRFAGTKSCGYYSICAGAIFRLGIFRLSNAPKKIIITFKGLFIEVIGNEHLHLLYHASISVIVRSHQSRCTYSVVPSTRHSSTETGIPGRIEPLSSALCRLYSCHS